MINNNFGINTPSLFGKFLLLLIKMGISRGKLKRLFHNIWKKYLSENPVDLIYNGIKLRVWPFGNTIESNILFCQSLAKKANSKSLKNL